LGILPFQIKDCTLASIFLRAGSHPMQCLCDTML
jgi:hypothetical protein